MPPTETQASVPTLADVARALKEHADRHGNVLPGVVHHVVNEHGWQGRIVDVLSIFVADENRMAYLSGGRRPDEVTTWLEPWVESSLSVDEIRIVIDCGGWDPDPFEVLSTHDMLHSFLVRPDGSARRVRGELAGGWLTDEFAEAEASEIVDAVRDVIAQDT